MFRCHMTRTADGIDNRLVVQTGGPRARTRALASPMRIACGLIMGMVCAVAPAACSQTTDHLLKWSAPQEVAAGMHFQSLSCPSVTFCMAIGATGPGGVNDAVSFDGVRWSSPQKIGVTADQVLSVSCPTATMCIAVDDGGEAMTFRDGSWSTPRQVDLYGGTGSISCPTKAFCMVTDFTGHALSFDGSSWSKAQLIDTGQNIRTVSCPTPTFCVALDDGGNVLTFNGVSWSGPRVIEQSGFIPSVSCVSIRFCGALGRQAHTMFLTYGSHGWSDDVRLRPYPANSYTDPLSCVSATFCVLVDDRGRALTFNGRFWSAPKFVDAACAGPLLAGLQSVDCPTEDFCVALDSSGNALTYSGGGT